MPRDYEYVRNGTANLFMLVEPLRGWRQVSVTTRRTKLDFAAQMKELVDVHDPRAKKITLVMDNLNTRKMSCLYEAFAPEEARRIIEKIEVVHTPKHGSWLNMAECELSVLEKQCLGDRIGATRRHCGRASRSGMRTETTGAKRSTGSSRPPMRGSSYAGFIRRFRWNEPLGEFANWEEAFRNATENTGFSEDETWRAIEEAREELERVAPLYEQHASSPIDPAQLKLF